MASDGDSAQQGISQKTLARRRFRAQMRRPWVIAIILILIAGGAVLAVAVNLWAGVATAVLGPILFVYLVPGWIADSRGEKDFWTYYAAIRRLDGPHETGAPIPGYTPLLTKGSGNEWEHVMLGELPGGVQGALGRYTFVIVTHDSDGDDENHYFHFTAVVAGAPEAAGMPTVYCHRHIMGGGGHIQRAEDQIMEPTRRIELESANANERYDVRIPKSAEENQVRQIFDPVLVDYLADKAPKGFNFEFYGGSVCAYVEEKYDSVEELDELCKAASMVTSRFRGEALEEV